MTEQQIRQLKAVLETSSAHDNSCELDSKILRAATAKADLLKQRKLQEKTSLFDLLSTNVVGAVAFSLMLTAGVFVALSQMVRVDSDAYSEGSSSQASMPPIRLEFNSVSSGEPQAGSSSLAFEKPVKRPPEPTLEIVNRDQLLAQMPLPNVQELLNAMEFSLHSDRDLAQQSMRLAMQDIRSMLGQGRLENARRRYEQLRESCEVCTLPSTLDALVRNASPRSLSG